MEGWEWVFFVAVSSVAIPGGTILEASPSRAPQRAAPHSGWIRAETHWVELGWNGARPKVFALCVLCSTVMPCAIFRHTSWSSEPVPY
eukprot:scaffold66791_cov17-Tisochrysis_lutea.AAC.3